MRTIVSVAARLISALRQNPCHARFNEKATNGITSLVLAVVGGADVVADDPPVLQRDDPFVEAR